MSKNKWYVLRIRSGQGEKVKKDIENKVLEKNLSDYFGQIIQPHEKIYTKAKGKKILKKRYLPYIFVSIDLESSSILREIIIDTEDVYGFLGVSGWGGKQEPLSVSPREIDLMLGKAQKASELTPLYNYNFIEGEKVIIIGGVFQNKIGVVKKINKGSKKLTVIISQLGEVELGYTEVKKLIKNI